MSPRVKRSQGVVVVLAIELLMARAVLRVDDGGGLLGHGTAAALRALDTALDRVPAGAAADVLHAAARGALPPILAAAESAIAQHSARPRQPAVALRSRQTPGSRAT